MIKNKIIGMFDSEFKTLKMKVISMMANTLTNDNSESGHYWRTICDRGLDFDRIQK